MPSQSEVLDYASNLRSLPNRDVVLEDIRTGNYESALSFLLSYLGGPMPEQQPGRPITLAVAGLRDPEKLELGHLYNMVKDLHRNQEQGGQEPSSAA